MSFYSSNDPYNRYAFLRWWCQNQWWVQIVVPCIVCAGVIGALLYQWNNERQQQVQDQIFQSRYKYDKEHPPELDPDLDEKAAAWRVIRMKKNDPSMPIPYKKKQLIVKHWKSIIVDMKAEEIQRLHDLLQDQPVKPTDDIEIDIRKFEAPWKDDVTLDDMDVDLGKTVPMAEDMPDPAKVPVEGGEEAADNPTPSENLKLPEKGSVTDSSPKDETDGAFQEETPEESPAPAKTEKSKKTEKPVKSASYFPTVKIPDVLEPILLDSSDEKTTGESVNQDASASYTDIDVMEPGQQAKGRARSQKVVSKTAPDDEIGPLEDNFLQQREEFIKKALEERNRKIEEFKKSQDPYQFIPSPWKRNPLVI